MTQLTPEEEAAAARAAEQIRLRKARREAKIKAGAESRLKTITGLGGGVQRDPVPAATPAAVPTSTDTTTATDAPSNGTPTPAAAATAAAPQHADPEEVDISQHFYQPQTTPRVPQPSGPNLSDNLSDARLRQIMLDLDRGSPGTGTPPSGMPPGMDDDAMLRTMMQMLGGGGSNNGGNPFANMGLPFPPPPLSQQQQSQQSQPQQQQQQATLPSRSSSLWRLLHTAVALSLGLYIALWTPFRGTRLERERAAYAAASPPTAIEEKEKEAAAKNLFWAFATAEAVLLTTRWFVDRGRGSGGGNGVVGVLAQFLPASVRAKVEIALRYGEVLGTVKGDVLVCVFVLGVAAWWRG